MAGALDDTGKGWIVFVREVPEIEAHERTSSPPHGRLFAMPANDHFASAIFDLYPSAAPKVVVADGGRARVAWLGSENEDWGSNRLQAGHLNPGTRWSERQEVSSGYLNPYGDFDLAGDRTGRALLVWESQDAVWTSVASPDAPFEPQSLLFDGVGVVRAQPCIAMNADGRAIVACRVDPGGGKTAVMAWLFDPAIGFTSLGRVDTAPANAELKVAAASDGTFAIGWLQVTDDGSEVAVRRCSADGLLAPIDLLGGFSDVVALDLLFDRDDALLVGFISRWVGWIRSPAAGLFDPRVDTALIPPDREGARSFGLVADVDGRVTCAAIDVVGVPASEVSALRTDGGAPANAPLTLHETAESGLQCHLTLISGGSTTLALWIGDDDTGIGGNAELFRYQWNALRPEWSVSPTTPAPNAPAVFDTQGGAWHSSSADLLYEWDFDGDGLFEASGELIEWRFPAAGTYSVTLRVTDDWGDRGESTRDVVVGGGGGGGPPWLLTVSRDGSGEVHGDDDADGLLEIDCPTDCTELYADGFDLFLKPRPDPLHHFVRWEGLDTGFGGDADYGVEGCVVRMTSDRSVKAVFAAD